MSDILAGVPMLVPFPQPGEDNKPLVCQQGPLDGETVHGTESTAGVAVRLPGLAGGRGSLHFYQVTEDRLGDRTLALYAGQTKDSRA